jgi:hypothetical protein
LAAARAHPANSGQPVGSPAAAKGVTSLARSARRPPERPETRVRRVWRAGLLGQQPAALGGLEQPLVDVVVVEGAGGDQVVEVAGRLPQLAVAPADGGGGDTGQFLGQRRLRVAILCPFSDGWELDWTGESLELAGLEPLE